MKATIALLLAGVFTVLGLAVAGDDNEDGPRRPAVLVLRLDDVTISPITARVLRAAIERGEREGVECVIVELDTPGGLLGATRSMVKDILGARVPVVIFVPSGGRAASAGVFLALASHVAAMAPGSNIGAAHPVQIGGGFPISPAPQPGPEGQDGAPAPAPKPMEKVVNDTAAWVRSLAEMRGRDPVTAEQTVTESVSFSASEAVRDGLVDLVAEDLGDLLESIDGREVTVGGASRRLETARALTREHAVWWGEELLAVLCNPNVAFLLLIFGFYGVLFELYSPGWGVAGTLGAVLLALGFFGLSVLPINYAGLLLLVLAFGMLVAEIFVTSYGALTAGGLVCLVLGALMLVDSPAGFGRVSLGVIIPVAAATAVIGAVLVTSVVRAHREPPRTGSSALVGARGLADVSFSREGDAWRGVMLVHGERWKAISRTEIVAGEEIEVEKMDGLTLLVRPASPDSPTTPSENS